MSLILDGTAGLSEVDGTAAAPAIRGTDANTGIFFPAADTVGIATSGTERLRIDSAGNVGIGTSSPASLLNLSYSNTALPTTGGGSALMLSNSDTSTSSVSSLMFRGTDAGGTLRHGASILWGKSGAWTAGGSNYGSYLALYTRPDGGDQLERMRIDSSGNVGIGTSSPTRPLHVFTTGFGVANFIASGGETNITIQNTGTNGRNWSIVAGGNGGAFSSGQFGIYDSTAAAARMAITSAGDVGIGTTAPEARLQANASSAFQPAFTARSDTSAVNWARIDWKNSNLAPTGIIYLDNSGLFAIRNDGASPIVFATNGANERMRIDSSGLVGIGTSSPSSRLTVTNGGIEIRDGNPLLLRPSGNANDNRLVALSNDGLDVVWGGAPTTSIMRWANGGNVGIGTSSPTQALTVNGAVGYNAPVTVTDSTHTVATTTNWIIANRAGTVTLTLPAAASFTGRILTVKNVQAQTVVSASSNVVPIGSTTAGTAILTNTAGKFATLVSDGTNWIIMQAN